jgi:hypothetical protein
MRRLALLAVLAVAACAAPAVAHTTGSPDASAACTQADSGDGGVPAGFEGGESGGTPADWDGYGSDACTPAGDGTSGTDATTAGHDATTIPAEELTATATGSATTGSGGALADSAGAPTAVAAQEPAAQPEGSGTQQPGDSSAQPPPVQTGDVPGAEAAAAQAPAGGTGGTLPFTGVEALQLMLLGIVLLLVGARLRVLALRRRRASAEPTWRAADRAYEEDFARPIAAHRAEQRPSRRAPQRDEWAFPDPDEPAPTGILPSTASARRRARMLAAERD